ncbi:hypothetical protein BKA62DRAFT_702498 [Auriculariales sp. MPI-PUGE-AT-0066]|nr:hypothetical protein BKA62DRAFT_702498 [Auriculariales sp. MPI-PUGE-AT-0066]
MRFDSVLFLLCTLMPLSFAMKVFTGAGSFDEQGVCLFSCIMRGISDTKCDIAASNAEQCACKTDSYATDVESCVKSRCPQFSDALKTNVTTVCQDFDSPLQAPPTTVCPLLCNTPAIASSGCKGSDTDCLCTKPGYATGMSTCAKDSCPKLHDTVIAMGKQGCDGHSPNAFNDIPSFTYTPASTGNAIGSLRSAAVGFAALAMALAMLL